MKIRHNYLGDRHSFIHAVRTETKSCLFSEINLKRADVVTVACNWPHVLRLPLFIQFFSFS
jgi:hypothetical protein